MNLSANWKGLLFESFFVIFKAASWSTYLSMSYEAALKMTKKSFKNQRLRICG